MSELCIQLEDKYFAYEWAAASIADDMDFARYESSPGGGQLIEGGDGQNKLYIAALPHTLSPKLLENITVTFDDIIERIQNDLDSYFFRYGRILGELFFELQVILKLYSRISKGMIRVAVTGFPLNFGDQK